MHVLLDLVEVGLVISALPCNVLQSCTVLYDSPPQHCGLSILLNHI